MPNNVLVFLWKYISKLKILFFSVILVVLFGEGCQQTALYFVSKIVELLSSTQPNAEVFYEAIKISVVVSILFLFRGLFYNVMIFMEARFMPVFMSRMSKDLFAFAHQHSTAFFAEEMAGNISGKIKTMIDNSYNMYYQILWGVISPLITILITLGFIYSVSPSLAGIFLALNILMIAILIRLSVYIAPYSELRSNAMSAANGILVDSISNSSLVKNFSNYLHEKRNYFRYVKKAARADRIEGYKYGVLFIVQGLLRSFLLVVFYVLPLLYWYKGWITVGEYVLITSLIMSLNSLYNHLTMNFLQMFKGYGSIRDGLKLLSQPCEVVDHAGAQRLKPMPSDIDLNQITYHYKGNLPLFENFSLKIEHGSKVGLVGRSGSGKSTLVKLLTRCYDIQAGQMTINGQDISKVTQDSLRAAIALIPQDPSLFNRTIMENIRYGKLNATNEEVYEASRKAFCHDFIMALPHGYDSKVGERGVMLSGGERQRIAIARALLKNAPILILDEATSALDSESEHYIQEALQTLMEGKTVISIAHRLSTLREMDQLVVLERGQIVEQGSHQALLRKKGIYFGFYNLQTSGFIKLDN